MKFSERLSSMRKARNLTQTDLAQMSNNYPIPIFDDEVIDLIKDL